MPETSLLSLRAEQYAQSKGILLRRERPLGYGTDGTVWRTSRPSAVKALEHERNYRNEVCCYQRLTAAGIDQLEGFAVPVLVDGVQIALCEWRGSRHAGRRFFWRGGGESAGSWRRQETRDGN